MLAKDKEYTVSQVQFSFYKRGYEKEGVNYALVLRNKHRYIVKEVVCYTPVITRTRRTNPVFVISTYGKLTIKNNKAVIC
jgi:hypothetical protein